MLLPGMSLTDRNICAMVMLGDFSLQSSVDKLRIAPAIPTLSRFLKWELLQS